MRPRSRSDSTDPPSMATDGAGLLLGRSAPMQQLFQQIERVALTDAPVLILGESGTGKELIARTLHDFSSFSQGVFVPVNCGAISPELVEAQLFGHAKGSFTGAIREHAGYFETASGGTLFLDEVTEMPLETQVKLLRVLETGMVTRVGGTDSIEVKVRAISATNRDPDSAAEAGLFREDLLYRLAVIVLRVPPLRERGADVELLAQHFLSELNRSAGTQKKYNRRSIDLLYSHTWPGNVRELRNAIQRAFILCDHEVDLGIIDRQVEAPLSRNGYLEIALGTSLLDARRALINATLEHFHGDKRKAAKALGVSLKTVYNRLADSPFDE